MPTDDPQPTEDAMDLSDDDFVGTPDQSGAVDLDDGDLDEPVPAHLPRLDPSVISVSRINRLGDRNIYQRTVYALLAHSLVGYRVAGIALFALLCTALLMFALGFTAGFAVTAFMGWALSLIGLADVLAWVVGCTIGGIAQAIKKEARYSAIELETTDNAIAAFKIGRLSEFLGPISAVVPVTLFGTVFGIQHALLMFTPSHFGLPIEGTFGESFYLTLDNACHGILLDAFELHDICWGKRLEHTTYSANTFIGFRIGFSAMAFYAAFILWKRFRLRYMLRDIPTDVHDVGGLFRWIESRSSDKSRWPRQYHDEFMFLLLAKAFIDGEFEFVQRLSRSLKTMNVTPEVRSLFRTTEGQSLYCSKDGKFDL